jgi:hypothetical protein
VDKCEVWVKTDGHKGLSESRRAERSKDYKKKKKKKKKKTYEVCHERRNFRREVRGKRAVKGRTAGNGSLSSLAS